MLREIRLRTARSQRSGFTLIELLIVVAIIGIIAAILIPNMLNALQKAKQKKTVADQRLVGTAMMAWLTDQSGAAAAGASQTIAFTSDYTAIALGDIRSLLIPVYIQEVPQRDGWQNAYDYRINVGNPGGSRVLGIRSFGRYGTADSDSYVPGGFVPTDYNQDIVWTDGFFLRWPEGLANN